MPTGIYDRKPAHERFWSKVDKSGECWLWTAGKDKDGYGFFRGTGKIRKAHRFAYELLVSHVPSDLCVCHSCDTPSCVRPDHLFLGTNVENTADSTKKGRRASGLRSGHYTHPERTARGDRNGKRTHPELIRIGEDHHGAKLTEQIVRDMRSLRIRGESFREIGHMFGVTKQTAIRVCKGKNWGHVK